MAAQPAPKSYLNMLVMTGPRNRLNLGEMDRPQHLGKCPRARPLGTYTAKCDVNQRPTNHAQGPAYASVSFHASSYNNTNVNVEPRAPSVVQGSTQAESSLTHVTLSPSHGHKTWTVAQGSVKPENELAIDGQPQVSDSHFTLVSKTSMLQLE